MRSVIEMAREAGIEFTYDPTETPVRAFVECWEDELERFADLVRADALVKPCCGDFDKCQRICMPRAAAQEREKFCAVLRQLHDSYSLAGHQGQISARGNK